jgi:hypothetical protein
MLKDMYEHSKIFFNNLSFIEQQALFFMSACGLSGGGGGVPVIYIVYQM